MPLAHQIHSKWSEVCVAYRTESKVASQTYGAIFKPTRLKGLMTI